MKKYKLTFLIALVLIASTLSFSSVLILNTTPASAATQQQCIDTGGTWGYAGSQLTCTCPSGSILVNGTGCRTLGQLCTDTGGTWSYAGGGSQLACTCPAGQSLQASRCQATPPPAGGPSDGDPLSQATCEAEVGEEINSSNCGIIKIIVVGINILSALAGMAIVFSIMFAGYQYMTARDNPGQTQKAKQRIVWALISLLVFIFMYAILNYLVPGGVLR